MRSACCRHVAAVSGAYPRARHRAARQFRMAFLQFRREFRQFRMVSRQFRMLSRHKKCSEHAGCSGSSGCVPVRVPAVPDEFRMRARAPALVAPMSAQPNRRLATMGDAVLRSDVLLGQSADSLNPYQ
jgi:hypothetical protein